MGGASIPLRTLSRFARCRASPRRGPKADESPLHVASGEVVSILQIEFEACFALPSLHAIEWAQDGQVLLSPIFELGERFMFGGAAHVFCELLVALEPAFDRPLPPLRAGRYAWTNVL